MPVPYARFIKNCLESVGRVDFTLYSDQIFCIGLQLYALHQISNILLSIEKSHLDRRNLTPNFIALHINDKDYLGYNIVDYCIVTGLANMANDATTFGGRASRDLDGFLKKIDELYPASEESSQTASDNTPEIINNIRATLEKIKLGETAYSQNVLTITEKIGFCSRINRRYADSGYKVALILFILGISCMTTGSFIPHSNTNSTNDSFDIPTILLTVIGIPSLFAAIVAFQTAEAGYYSGGQIDNVSRVAEEDRVLHELRESALKYAREIEDAEHNITRRFIAALTNRGRGSQTPQTYQFSVSRSGGFEAFGIPVINQDKSTTTRKPRDAGSREEDFEDAEGSDSPRSSPRKMRRASV
jgi:hypothetical protein